MEVDRAMPYVMIILVADQKCVHFIFCSFDHVCVMLSMLPMSEVVPGQGMSGSFLQLDLVHLAILQQIRPRPTSPTPLSSQTDHNVSLTTNVCQLVNLSAPRKHGKAKRK